MRIWSVSQRSVDPGVRRTTKLMMVERDCRVFSFWADHWLWSRTRLPTAQEPPTAHPSPLSQGTVAGLCRQRGTGGSPPPAWPRALPGLPAIGAWRPADFDPSGTDRSSADLWAQYVAEAHGRSWSRSEVLCAATGLPTASPKCKTPFCFFPQRGGFAFGRNINFFGGLCELSFPLIVQLCLIVQVFEDYQFSIV